MSAPAPSTVLEKGAQPLPDQPATSPPEASSQAAPTAPAQTTPDDLNSSPVPNDNAAISNGPPTYEDVTSSRNGFVNGPPPGDIQPAQRNNVGIGAKGAPPQQHNGPVMVTPLAALTEAPTMIDCPWCHRQAMTTTEKEGTPMQIVAGIVLCIFCVCLACLPCIAGMCEDTHIMCSACHKKVATLPDGGAPIQLHLPPNMVQVPSQYHSHPPPGPVQAQQVPSHYPASPPPAHTPGQAPPQQQPTQ